MAVFEPRLATPCVAAAGPRRNDFSGMRWLIFIGTPIIKYILAASEYTRKGIITVDLLAFIPERVYINNMSLIGEYIKKERKKAGLTQEQFALMSGLGLRFVRELEQGKETVRLDKVDQALGMFGMRAVPGEIDRSGLDDKDR